MAAATRATIAARLQLVGEPRLELGPDAAFVLERKDAALLALIAIDGPAPRARVAAMLWPDVDESSERNNLRQRLHRLRKRAGRDVVLALNDTLRLADDIIHDLIDLPDRLGQDAAAAAGELLGTYEYEDLPDLAEWVAAARERWRTIRRDALAQIAARLETEGHIALALQYAERLVADDPLLEHAHRRLMRLHYLRGDRAAALAAFERCRQSLKRGIASPPAKETLELARLIDMSGALPAPAPASPRPVAVLRPPKLVGRDTEWGLLRQAWSEARIALIAGEPGIGKSRLLTDFAAAHDRTLVTGARPGDARLPYATLARLLRAAQNACPIEPPRWAAAELAHLLPEFGAASAKLEGLRLRRAIAETLAGWQARGIAAALIDDLQFADDASLEMILLLADRESSLRWLFGVRGSEMPAALEGWRRRCDPEHLLFLELGPLDVPAIEALLESMAIPNLEPRAWAEALARHTGGNPLFILETVGILAARPAAELSGAVIRLPAPGTVSQLIERRLSQLSPRALKLARLAAVAGQDFTAELAAAVLGEHPLDLTEAWRELEAAQVLNGSGFAHDLIYETTLRSLPEPIAGALHRSVALLLEAQDGAPVRIAQHWAKVADHHRAAQWFDRAARDAAKASRRVEELSMLQEAIAHLERVDPMADAIAALAARAAEAAVLVGSAEQARDLAERALAGARSPDTRLAALEARALTADFLRDADGELKHAKEGLALARRHARRDFECRFVRLSGLALANSGRYAEAVAVFEGASVDDDPRIDADTKIVFLVDHADVLDAAGKRERALQVAQQAHELAQARDDCTHAVACLSNMAGYSSELGRMTQAIELLERALELSKRLGEEAKGQIDLARLSLGTFYRDRGRFAEGLKLLTAVLETFKSSGAEMWAASAANLLAGTYVNLGQPARAQKVLAPLAPHLPQYMHGVRSLLQAWIARRTGQPALPLIRRAIEILGNDDRASVDILAHLELASELPPRDGAQLALQMTERARAREHLALEIDALTRACAALLSAGDPRRAAESARRLVGLIEQRTPWRIYVPEIHLTLYQCFEAVGDKAAAQGALRQGADWIRQTALPNVPAEFADSFLHRNPINRAILTAAGRLLR
jgi:DNA-binding SARP family transcriptional activator